jgi:subtilisin family serine protease
VPTRSFTRTRVLALLGAALLVTGSVELVVAAEPATRPADAGRAWDQPSTERGRLVVTLEGSATRTHARGLADTDLTLVDFDGPKRRAIYTVAPGRLRAAQRRLERDPAVQSVNVSHRLSRDVDPDPQDEEHWSYLWGLHNAGQTLWGSTGVADVDVDGLQSLGVTTGAGVVVAVIDDGVDFTRPDLAGQAWTNPGESGDGRETNGVDDDANGYVDDVNGWDFCHDDKTVHDPGEDFHGTHVAGTIAASLNGTGIVGVAPGVRIMALKFLGDGVDENDEPVCGWDDQVLEAIEYARSFDVRISNNSWGRIASPADDTPLYNAIRDSEMLFVSSAGNNGVNNDSSVSRSIPASFNLANILTVAAVDNKGNLASFSNYGSTTVDIAAPGVNIVSANPAYDFDGDEPCCAAGWIGLSGTSMAAPHVTGIAALVAAQVPSLLDSPTGLKARILATGKARGSTAGKTVTGRIADAWFALDSATPTASPPNSHAFLVGKPLGSTILTRVRWPAGTDDVTGIVAYTLGQSVGSAAYTTVTSSATGTWVDRPLSIGSFYTFRVRARDRAGNTGGYAYGPQVRPLVAQQTGSALLYTGAWTTSSSSSASGGSTRFATKAGASVSYTFTGRAIAVVAPKGPTRGSFRVYVDGAYAGVFSTYRSSGQSRMVVFAKHWTTSASHTVKVVVVGTAGHPRFDLDAFAVLR